MRMRLGELRRLIRAALLEGPSGPGVTADPTEVRGFYPYEAERGADIAGYWYLSPGDKGTNPMRPDDPAEYIGLKPPAGGAAEGEDTGGEGGAPPAEE